MVSTQFKRNQTISALFKKKKQTKETRIYYISAKNVNEQIKAKYFFCHESVMFQKKTDETAALDERSSGSSGITMA